MRAEASLGELLAAVAGGDRAALRSLYEQQATRLFQEAIAELLPSATPSSSAVFGGMTLDERQRVIRALVDDFHERQGDGPFAMTCEGLLAVATKPV